MRFLQKLVRNGNATMVTIPINVLDFCGWSCGQNVVVEAREDKTVIVRTPTLEDFHRRRTVQRGPTEIREGGL